jgi:hypothetical protein
MCGVMKSIRPHLQSSFLRKIQSPVSLHDVAYWPMGKAICLFYGPTPIGKNGEITPASSVNVIGKIIDPDKSILDTTDGKEATFRLKS